MGKILVNPGTGECENGTYKQALVNIKQFIKDCEIELYVKESNHTSEEGRYLFILRNDEFDFETEVEMPGMPLEEVRYIGLDEQNVLDFPRLYVDGGSWLWKYAIITKEVVIDIFEDQLYVLQNKEKFLNECIEKLKK